MKEHKKAFVFLVELRKMPQLDLTTFIFLYFSVICAFWFQFVVSYVAVSYAFQYYFSSFYFPVNLVTLSLLRVRAIVSFRGKRGKKSTNSFIIRLSEHYK